MPPVHSVMQVDKIMLYSTGMNQMCESGNSKTHCKHKVLNTFNTVFNTCYVNFNDNNIQALVNIISKNILLKSKKIHRIVVDGNLR